MCICTHCHKFLQEVNGWCEENTYEKLRKAMSVAIKRLAAEAGKYRIEVAVVGSSHCVHNYNVLWF